MVLPSRINRGRSSQIQEDADLLKAASLKRWLFYTKGDDVPFVMEHNSTLWPSNWTLEGKMAMKKSEKICVKTSTGNYMMSLVCICDAEKTNLKAQQVHQKVQEAETSMTDVSLNE